MRKITLIACMAVSLSACAGLTGAGARMDEAEVLIGAQGLFDAAVVLAQGAAASGLASPARISALDALADQGEALARAARAAYAAGDLAAAGSGAAALAAVAGQIQALAPTVTAGVH
jgi:hypothetical protein